MVYDVVIYEKDRAGTCLLQWIVDHRYLKWPKGVIRKCSVPLALLI